LLFRSNQVGAEETVLVMQADPTVLLTISLGIEL
jgi:hypothetical protein